jgi:hypothetical protein
LTLDENQSRGASGYGVYKKQYESDALENIVANCENDRDLNKRREMQNRDQQKAAKVIFKFNENSIRVMDSMKNVRDAPTNQNILEEEL